MESQGIPGPIDSIADHDYERERAFKIPQGGSYSLDRILGLLQFIGENADNYLRIRSGQEGPTFFLQFGPQLG